MPHQFVTRSSGVSSVQGSSQCKGREQGSRAHSPLQPRSSPRLAGIMGMESLRSMYPHSSSDADNPEEGEVGGVGPPMAISSPWLCVSLILSVGEEDTHDTQ